MRRWLLLLLIPVLIVLGFLVWALTGPGAMPEAEFALQTDETVEVSDERWLVFSPTENEPTSGLILYPVGRVDPVAYAPLAREIAAGGHLVVIVPMPLNLAFLGANRAMEVMDTFPEISTWAIGGHSLGGAMAANYVDGQPDRIEGLALWAAYPAQSDDLSDLALEVVSIYGTNDGVTTIDDIRGSETLLPENASWVAIDGGNHS